MAELSLEARVWPDIRSLKYDIFEKYLMVIDPIEKITPDPQPDPIQNVRIRWRTFSIEKSFLFFSLRLAQPG